MDGNGEKEVFGSVSLCLNEHFHFSKRGPAKNTLTLVENH